MVIKLINGASRKWRLHYNLLRYHLQNVDRIHMTLISLDCHMKSQVCFQAAFNRSKSRHKLWSMKHYMVQRCIIKMILL